MSTGMIRVLQISDTHLRSGDAASLAFWPQLQAFVRADPPDLIVHTGDLIKEEPDNEDDRRFAAACLRALDSDVVCIPGNHDIGDGPPGGTGPDPLLLDRFRIEHGAAHWVRRIGGWAFVGVNAMLFGSGLPSEAAEWVWLQDTLADVAGLSVAVFLHKPPFGIGPADSGDHSAFIAAKSRDRLWSLLTSRAVQLVACGHRHEYRVLFADRILTVWAPTTSTLLDERTPPLAPYALPGLIEYVFTGASVLHRPIYFERDAQR
jgi:3',5'-cyclic AMP phosphodiesterase CpdA